MLKIFRSKYIYMKICLAINIFQYIIKPELSTQCFIQLYVLEFPPYKR